MYMSTQANSQLWYEKYIIVSMYCCGNSVLSDLMPVKTDGNFDVAW